MKSFKPSLCTAQTEGVIISKRLNEYINMVCVEAKYSVSGKDYTVTEIINYKSVDEVINGILIGGADSVMKNTSVGTKVTIMFDPNCPQNAYIKENLE